MVVVLAGGVTAVGHIEGAVFHLLGGAAHEVPFPLLGDYVAYVSALCLEVVLHALGLVGATLVGEYGEALAYGVAGRVELRRCVDRRGVHLHVYVVGVELEVGVFHGALAVEEGVVLAEHYQGVGGVECHDVLDVHLAAVDYGDGLALEDGVAVQGVACYEPLLVDVFGGLVYGLFGHGKGVRGVEGRGVGCLHGVGEDAVGGTARRHGTVAGVGYRHRYDDEKVYNSSPQDAYYQVVATCAGGRGRSARRCATGVSTCKVSNNSEYLPNLQWKFSFLFYPNSRCRASKRSRLAVPKRSICARTFSRGFSSVRRPGVLEKNLSA